MEENADLDHFSKEKIIITILKDKSYHYQNRKSVCGQEGMYSMCVCVCVRVCVYPHRNRNGLITLFFYNMKN